jgi:hypothetical protein
MKVKIRKNLIMRYVEKSDVDIVYYFNPNRIKSFYVVKKNSVEIVDKYFVSYELAERHGG